jgi:hypothetical protein
MKYLFICTPVETQVTPAQRLKMLQETKKYIAAQIKNGTIESIYNFIEYGGIAIVNVDSAEAARNFLADFPVRQLYEWDVKPLLENEKAIDGAIARLKKGTRKKK